MSRVALVAGVEPALAELESAALPLSYTSGKKPSPHAGKEGVVQSKLYRASLGNRRITQLDHLRPENFQRVCSARHRKQLPF